MFTDLKKDYQRNNCGKRVLVIMGIYRLGNLVYYSKRLQFFKKPLLLLMNILYKIFVFYPLNIEIPFSCNIGPGLRIVHQHGIVINGGTTIGNDCTIYHQVTIGENELSDKKGSPKIGNDVFIGAGAKIIGDLEIGNNCRVGANAVVIHNMPDNSVAICRESIHYK